MDRGSRFDLRARRTRLIAACVLYVFAAGYVAWRRTAVDYPVYVIAASGFLRGEDVYAWSPEEFRAVGSRLGIERHEVRYLYPPLTALVAAPFVDLPYRLGLLLWSLLNAAAVIGTGLILARLVPDDRLRPLVEIATWLFVPFLTSLYAGQVNPLVVFFAAAALFGAERGRDRAAGAALAVSLLLKPLAIGLVAYGVWRGRWRFVGSVALCCAALLLVCWSVFGDGAFRFLATVSAWSPRGYPPSQNLPGLVLRWFGEPDRTLVTMVAATAAVAAVVATALACGPPGRSRSWSAAEIAAVLAAVLLTHARTWYHHFGILSLAFVLLLSRGSRSPFEWALLAVAYALVQLFGLAWHRLTASPLALESATFGALIVWGVALLEARRGHAQPGAAEIVSGRQ